MARLHEAGYLDDARAGRERARHLAERGYGNAAIGLELERRGVPPGLVDEATAALEPEGARAKRLARSLGGGDRAARALARKGFGQEAIEEAIAAVANDC